MGHLRLDLMELIHIDLVLGECLWRKTISGSWSVLASLGP